MRFDVSHVEDNHGLILNPWYAVKQTAMESLAVVVLVLLMNTDLHDESYHMACMKCIKNVHLASSNLLQQK